MVITRRNLTTTMESDNLNLRRNCYDEEAIAERMPTTLNNRPDIRVQQL